MRTFAAAFILASLASGPSHAQTVKERLPACLACLACHGENGQSQNPEVPSLGAQQAFYVMVQLLLFRERMRVVEPMNEAAKGLSDDDLRGFAETISKLPAPQPMEGPVDNVRIERARVLVVQNRCDFCHTPTFAGQDNVPHIASQREDYLIKSLRGYKDNSRHGYEPFMASVTEPLTDDEILDLAYYIARMK